MKILKIPFLVLMVAALFSSCRKDDDNGGSNNGGGASGTTTLELKKAENIYAPGDNTSSTGETYVKFDFATGSTTTSETDWDIAFKTTTIIVNGGATTGVEGEPTRTGNGAAYITNGTFNDITSVNESLLKQDAEGALAIPTGSGNGWYLYDMTDHTISPIAGKVIVVKTHDGKYAKMEVLGYYDTAGNARNYSFNYVYQPNGTSF